MMFFPLLKRIFHEVFWLERLFDWLAISCVEIFVLVGCILFFKTVFKKRLSPQWSYYIWIFALLRLVVLFIRCMWFVPAGSFEFSSYGWIMFWVWAAGAFTVACFQLFRVVGFFVFVRKLKEVQDPQTCELLEKVKEQLGVRINIRVFATELVTSPALVGVFRPRILIPPGLNTDFSASEQRFIFLHELAHFKRSDIFVKWVVFVFNALFWFHPLVWFALWKAVCECEINCDFHALAFLNEKEKFEYANTVLKFIEHLTLSRRIPSLLGFGSSKRQIKKRIQSIADFNPLVSRQIPHLDFAVILFLGILVFSFPVLPAGVGKGLALRNVTSLVAGDHMTSFRPFHDVNYQQVLYDYVKPGYFAGQSFCASAGDVVGAAFFIGKRYEENNKSLLKGTFDLVLYEFADGLTQVRELARKRFVLKSGQMLKKKQEFFFNRRVFVIPGKLYMIGLQSEKGFCMKIRQAYESDYPWGAMGIKPWLSDRVKFGVKLRDYLFMVFSSQKTEFDFLTLYSPADDKFLKPPQGGGVSDA